MGWILEGDGEATRPELEDELDPPPDGVQAAYDGGRTPYAEDEGLPDKAPHVLAGALDEAT